MGTRSDELARRFEQAVDEFAKEVQSCGDAQWDARCGAEGWTVGVTAQHVAGQFPLEREFIDEAASGGKGLTYSWDDINGMNDGRAAAHAGCTKDAVLTLLRDGGGSMAAYIRGLSDEQLDRTAPLALAGGAELTAQQLIEGPVLIEHVSGHLASMRAAG
ncbi:MAG: DinB family protein [Dehalococcoidia bacterium]|nr:DinB family protein [Dehalococcoidia bacterium]